MAELRAECSRIGVREVTVARGTARVTPIELRPSQQVRLQRVARDGVYKAETGQLVVPAAPGRRSGHLRRGPAAGVGSRRCCAGSIGGTVKLPRSAFVVAAVGLPLLLVVALATACGSAGTYAARVNDQTISEDSLVGELRSIAANDAFLKQVESQQQAVAPVRARSTPPSLP